ncbi:unnamed protein product [Choristocarpus tenellus]
MRTVRFLGAQLKNLGSPPPPAIGLVAFENILETVRGVPFPMPRAFFHSKGAARLWMTALSPPSKKAWAAADAAVAATAAPTDEDPVSNLASTGYQVGVAPKTAGVKTSESNGCTAKREARSTLLQSLILRGTNGREEGWNAINRARANAAREVVREEADLSRGLPRPKGDFWLLQGCVSWNGRQGGGLPPVCEVILKVHFRLHSGGHCEPPAPGALSNTEKGGKSGTSQKVPPPTPIQLSADVFSAESDMPRVICFRKELQVPCERLANDEVQAVVVDVLVRIQRANRDRCRGNEETVQWGPSTLVAHGNTTTKGETWWLGRTTVALSPVT